MQHLHQLAQAVFTHAFADAIRPTLILPIVAVFLAALCALAVSCRPKSEAVERKAA